MAEVNWGECVNLCKYMELIEICVGGKLEIYGFKFVLVLTDNWEYCKWLIKATGGLMFVNTWI
jgi:hypothetical protein